MEVSKGRRMQTIDALLDGYSSLSVVKLLEPLATDFHHQILPESLGMPIRDRDAFAKHAAGIFGVFEEFRMIRKTIVDDAVAGMVVIDAQMLGTLKSGKGEWNNECIMMVRLTEDGCKVLNIQEFVDSAKAVEMARTHKPKDFGSKASDTFDTKERSLFDWAVIDSDTWIYVGTAVIALIGLRRIFS
ncbi:hypothetical protein F5Y09DRAFT_341661 [Xylaria sp. FL1042]|nr:hypothetical protein F5Y09DRAFT_341661 [Xylaria sp. FL1042]